MSMRKYQACRDAFCAATLLLFVIIVWSGEGVAALAGDVAPYSNPDGQLNAADLAVAMQFINGAKMPNAVEQLSSDVAPYGMPDGVLDIGDYLVLERAVMGLITLDPFQSLPPVLWGSAGPVTGNPYFVSGLTDPNVTVKLYRDGVYQGSTVSNANGLYSYNVPLVAGALHSITATSVQGSVESAVSNSLSVILQAAQVAGPDLSQITLKYRPSGRIDKFQAPAGTVSSGATVIISYVDGTQDTFTADTNGGFDPSSSTFTANSLVASVSFTDTSGNESTQSIVTTVGTVAGTFDVDPSGAATYSIPIAVPPGTAGLTPGLSLNYSSNGGNGPMGRGWSLGGLSAITRCPKTIVQDNQPGGINLDVNDRFCLDGQRLVAVSGAYGADQTEYRTEIESFTRVISYGGSGTSPAYFQAWTRAGQKIRYGFNPDSGFNPGGADTLLWAADRVEDKAGNYLAVAYYEDTVTGEHYPLQVNYTGNDAVALAPYNSIQLVYENRPDASSGYVGGSKVTSVKRLQHIQVNEGAGSVRDYRLSYSTSPTSGMSRPGSVTECDSAATDAACLMPVVLNWSTAAAGFMASVSSGSTNSGYANAQVMEVNGDGRQDLVVPHDGYWWINYGAATGFLPQTNTNVSTTGSYPDLSLVIDYNSDGLTDLLVPGSDGYWDLLLADNTGFDLVTNLIPNQGYNNKPLVIDINGDGRQDLVVLHNPGSGRTRHVHLNTPGGFAPMVNTGLLKYDKNDLIIDYNNDGRPDILNTYYRGFINGVQTCEWWLMHFDGQTYRYERISNATMDEWGMPAGCFALNASGNNARVGDINADGLQDLVYHHNQGDLWRLLPNTGDGLNGPLLVSGQDDINLWYAQPLDYNQDGRVDYLIPSSTDNRWHVYQSGNGTVSNVDTGLASTGFVDALVMDVNGDGMQDIVAPYNGVWNVHFRQGPIPDQLTSITNGMGIATGITYQPLTDTTVYTKGTSADPARMEQDFQSALYVVSQTRIDDGIGGQYVTDYTYAGARVHLQGRGMLGFRAITTSDPQTGIATTTTYRQDFPFTGMPESSESFLNNQLIARTVNAYAEVANINGAAGVHFPYVSQSTEVSYDLPLSGVQGALIKTTVTSTAFDNYANPLTIQVDTTDAGGALYRKLTTNTYDPADINAWVLDRVSRTEVLHRAPNTPDITKASAFTYYPVGGVSAYLLKEEIIEPDAGVASPLYLKSTHEYDSFGNQTKVTSTGRKRFAANSALESRVTETQYDSQGRFPEWTRNALGHTEYYTHDSRFGTQVSLTGPNALATQWSYDSFGRKVLETRADGTQTTWRHDFCAGTDCPNDGFIETVAASGTTPVISYHDALQRVIRAESVAMTGQVIYEDTAYDNRGNVASKTRPYLAGAAPQETQFSYDALNRPIHEQAPDGGMVDYVYTGFARNTHRHHAAGGYDQYDTRVNDAMDQLVAVIDAMNGTQSYVYDATGNLLSTTDTAGNNTLTAYDLRGRKNSMDDPDMGHWEYRYNAFGELVWQKDAKNQVVYLYYDQLGRMTSRTEPEGATTWSYDGAAYGVGKLANVSVSYSGHSQNYTYDSLGRVAAETSTINGRSLTLAYSYDGYSRAQTVTYPTGFMVRNVYDGQGFLVEVRDAANDSPYWHADEDDAEGRITMETLGNGLQTLRTYDAANGSLATISTGFGTSSAVQDLDYVFDALGNLKQRSDGRQNRTETFAYDSLNRLTGDTLVGVGSKSYRYDALGNILQKPDYAGSYSYGAGTAGPHAVTQVKNGTTVLTSYTYDANGNMTGGDGRTLTWSSFNQPLSIAKGATTISFAYDADHQRVKQVSGSTTTYYLNPSIHSGVNYEEELTGAITSYKHYIHAGGRAIAIYTQQSDNTRKTRYLHTDHLGSTDVLTDESGAVIERMSFAAFGSRRHADWNNTTSVLTGIETHHGFTGHEQLDDVGIIHMNGRLYDPKLGRFLSPDVQIQYPDQTQSFNRYTYVNNNPLSYTDPSGYGFFSSLWKSIKGVFKTLRPIIAIAAAVWTLGWTAVLTGNIFIAGAVSGFVGGLIASGGDFRSAVIGALTGVAFAGVGSAFGRLAAANGGALSGTQEFFKTLSHGAVGGLQSKLQGGKFISGFLSVGFSQASSQVTGLYQQGAVIGNTIKAAVVGGAGAVLGGGKFENGASTFGFLRLFGEMASYAARETDRLKQLACSSGGRACVVDERGVLRTDGARDIDYSLNSNPDASNWLTSAGMAPEGTGLHVYEGNTLARYFITDVSKIHDWFNSWSYSSSTGFYMSQGVVFDSAFQLYSFAGMPIAGMATVAGYAGNAPFEQQMLYYNIVRNSQ